MTDDKKGGADFPPKTEQIAQQKSQVQNSATDSAQKSQNTEREERVLRFWQNNEIFEKSLEKNSPKGEFVFYDGPPFATGKPHYGHILAGTIKDIIPRYKTMQGYHVDRHWGWDCHGLPIESLIQKENNLNTKKDIEAFGIKNFNQAAKASVFRYDSDWKEIVPRTGRWVDMEDQYTTMDNNFMESVWWGFKKLHDKGLVYENFRSMHISPLLETPLSNFEVNQNYKDITDISVYAKFQLIDVDDLIGNTLAEAYQKADQKIYLVAWTTTPWTLFGNTALAINSKITYVKVAVSTESSEKEIIIIAKDRVEKVLEEKEYEIISEILGNDLVGKKYIPVFKHYYKNNKLENYQNGWKVYSADFVTTEDGTGIVHIAPAFGEDDLQMGQKENLPFIQHVNLDGTIKEEIPELAGRQAKPKSDEKEPNKHQETDIEILKILAADNKLFKKEKYTHSYPHCWRTGAPLLNYALSSWFIKVTDFKNKMSALNKKINWVPDYVGEKRFGNWLENIKDWGVSRSRFWGTPIPIWKSEDGSEIEVLGSVADIKAKTKSNNKYFLARHGESDHNVKKFLNSDNTVISNLTDKGKKQAQKAGQKLKGQKIDYLFCSPLKRTKDTAEIITNIIDFPKDQIIFDDRIQETQFGILNGQSGREYSKLFQNVLDKFTIAPEGGETIADIRRRIGDFIYDLDSKYQNKNILIVTHEYPTWAFLGVRDGLDNKQMADLKELGKDFVPTGNLIEYDFASLPHDDDYILDLHRPYIDEIIFEKNGKTMYRIPDIFDGWMDSGSMPFAAPHYPFENKMSPGGFLKSSKNFPADFIAEGLDQTRGWFYTLLVLNAGLFDKSPYKNVVVNGLVLAEDGQKMSKSLRNYPDPGLIIDKYGADAIRYYMVSSPAVQSEPLNFTEKGVDEIQKKIIQRFLNVISFYELYKDSIFDKKESQIKDNFDRPNSENLLDQWIIARLDEVLFETTKGLDSYNLDDACRPFFDFVDDLSTWYLRRSRDRIKGDNVDDKEITLKTLSYVIFEFSKIVSPFMPFVAETVYQTITGYNFKNSKKSIHLLSWSTPRGIDREILDQMKKVRNVVGMALEARDINKIKVRQPLQKITIGIELDDQLKNIIAEEINVKEVLFDEKLDQKEINLDTNITEALRQEGVVRELVRFIQSYRKELKLHPADKIKIQIKTSNIDLIKKFDNYIKKIVNAKKIDFADSVLGKDFDINNIKFIIKIKR